jgi:lipoate-protein ligase A
MKVLDTKTSSAIENMRKDAELLDKLDPSGDPLLHFYRWEGLSVTHGYFIQPHQWFNLEKVASNQVSLARRPTGGGIVFHIWDFAFSFLMPSGHAAFSINTLDNYRFVNEVVLDAVKELFSLQEPVELISENAPANGLDCTHFCMARPTQYDVVYQGMKIAGAAQRRRKQGFLHQGTISLAFPDFELLQELLLSQEEVIRAMSSYTFAPLGKACSSSLLQQARQKLQEALEQKFMEKLESISYTSG